MTAAPRPDAALPGAGGSAPVGPGGPRRDRRLSFDVLRVGFVLLVVLYHGTFIGPMVYPDMIPRNVVFPHQIGASLLLVLSAYFAAATVRKHGLRDGSGRWWWGKIARLLPAFVVATVAAWLALVYLAPGGWFLPTGRDLVANLLMLWNWNGLWAWDYVDGSYWTIPLQLMAFTVAALIWRTPLGRGTGLRLLMWGALLVPLAQWSFRRGMDHTLYSALVDGFGLHRWHLFVAGVAVWLFAAGRLGRVHLAALLSTAVLAHAMHNLYLRPDGGHAPDPWAVVGIGLGMLALLAAAVGPDWGSVVPRALHPAVTWLAGVSYGVFLVHQTLGYVFMRRLQELGVGPTLQTASMVLAAVVAGWALTRTVEQPAHRRLLAARDRAASRFRRGREARQTPAAISSRS